MAAKNGWHRYETKYVTVALGMGTYPPKPADILPGMGKKVKVAHT